jgi:hypothetical protein
MSKWSRRRFLTTAASALPAFAAGCGTAPSIDGFPPACGPSPDPGVATIDVHTHVFNASDLQVSRFLTRVAASEFSPILRELIAALAPILEWAGWAFAPNGQTELDHLNGLIAKARVRGTVEFALADEIARDREAGRQAFLKGFPEALKRREGERFLRAYNAHRQAVRAVTPRALQEREIFTLSMESMRTPEGLAAFVAAEQSLDGKRPLTFAANFFQYRYINALYLLENYGCVNGKVGIFACHMVDFDYGLGALRSPPTTLDMQIEVMSRIHVLSQGRIIPFAPFDPWRDYMEHGTALKRVKDAVTTGKSLGIKLYPPMGFAPAGNAQVPRPSGWPSDPSFPAGLDNSMNALFDWCAAEGVPVLAHANRTNAADGSFLDLGGPDRWRQAIDAHKQLRICFGHFGGDCLLAHTMDCSNWAEGFLDAFSYGKYVYADWSYFEHVLPGDDRKALVKRAKALFDKGGDLARSRIAYGSDWLMLAIEPGAELYYSDFASLVGDLGQQFSGIAEQFFVKNGAQYLNLISGGATRRRIEQTFSRQGARPSWLDAPQLKQ